jgi:hypothetical protein
LNFFFFSFSFQFLDFWSVAARQVDGNKEREIWLSFAWLHWRLLLMTLDQKRHTQESRARGAGHPTAAA